MNSQKLYTTRPKCRFFLCCTVAALLSGCSSDWFNSPMDARESQQQAQAPTLSQPQSIMPERLQAEQDPAMQSWANPVQSNAPAKSSSAPENTQGSDSLEQRVGRLENEVMALRRDMDRLLPALRRLLSGKEEVADIVADMQDQPQKTITSPQNKKMKPVLEKAEHTVPASTYKGPPKLANIRTGEHKGFTRMVMDVGSPTPFRVDVDNDERLLIIELPQASHMKSLTGILARSTWIKSYQTQAMNGGSRVIVQLQKPVRVRNTMTLKPSGARGARIALDIGASL